MCTFTRSRTALQRSHHKSRFCPACNVSDSHIESSRLSQGQTLDCARPIVIDEIKRLWLDCLPPALSFMALCWSVSNTGSHSPPPPQRMLLNMPVCVSLVALNRSFLLCCLTLANSHLHLQLWQKKKTHTNCRCSYCRTTGCYLHVCLYFYLDLF